MVVMIGHPFQIHPGNQDIDANIEVWNFVSKFDMDGLIGCNSTSSDNSIISSSKEIVRIVNILV